MYFEEVIINRLSSNEKKASLDENNSNMKRNSQRPPEAKYYF
jgi:hypothetical protein